MVWAFNSSLLEITHLFFFVLFANDVHDRLYSMQVCFRYIQPHCLTIGDLPPNKNFGMNTLSLKQGDVVEFCISNNDGGQHPLHLHGK